MHNIIIQDSSLWELMSRIGTDINQRKQERNLLKAVRFGIGRLGWSDVFHHDQLYIMSQLVNTNPADLDLDIPGITFREGTAEDVHLFPQIFKWKSAADAHKRMIDSGDVMALAFDGDRPIGIYLASIWQDNVNPHESDFKAIRRLFDITVGEDAISHGLFVLPDCRQRGVGAQLSFELSKALAKHGCKQVYSVINIKNEASVRTHQKIGRQTVANVSSTQIFNFKIIRPQSTSAENINRAKATSR